MSNPTPFLKRSSCLLVAALVMSGGLSAALAASAFTAPDTSFGGSLQVSTQPVYAGTEIELAGRGFKANQQVVLLRGETQLTSEALVADAEGNVSGKISIPADAAVGIHPVVMQVSGPDAASIINLKVSPNIPLSGDNLFNIQSASLPAGLYQSAYSPRNNTLFVTRAVGRPPVKESGLLKIDPQTLRILGQIEPALVTERDDGHRYAVYGIAVDDRNGNVWVGNTRDNTVAVYRQSDLSLAKQFPRGTVTHPRDLVVDEARNRVYVSASTTPYVSVLDGNTLEFIKSIHVPTQVRARGSNFTTMGLALDATNNRLYTASMGTPELAVINTRTDRVERILTLPNATRATGVAWNPVSRHVGVVSQGTDNLLIVNPENGDVIADVAVGAGSLNVTADPVSGNYFVSNRGSDTLTVVDATGKIIANLDGGSYPNHVNADGKGNIFAVNKARGANDARGDFVRRITLQ